MSTGIGVALVCVVIFGAVFSAIRNGEPELQPEKLTDEDRQPSPLRKY